MAEQPTCGKGLASQSSLPAMLGELSASVAENLEVHMKALDLNDASASKELEAYVKLAKKHREIATLLTATANEMAGYRELPMADHDAKVMSEPKAVKAFEKFMNLEQELLALLEKRVEQDHKMLVQMRRAIVR
ncbi:MAG TPA: hypothetical protein VGW77_33765 [Candidatus Binatia bacterium]|jgi:hypothetical protein|nr:hypothetical protein [Candidatus Binatia bacterium]